MGNASGRGGKRRNTERGGTTDSSSCSSKEDTSTIMLEEFLMKQAWHVSFEHIKLFKKIGFGGSGQVWSGTFSGQNVALKELHSVVFDADDIEEFKHEASVLASLHHPSLPKFYGVSIDNITSRYFLVLEYFPHVLSEVWEGASKASFDVANLKRKKILRICQQISQTLVYLHKRNVVHRDLKPENVLLTSFPELKPKISDFGLAKKLTTMKSAKMTTNIGTPCFMAPELFDESNFDEKSTELDGKKIDAYAFAMLMWSVLEFVPPFHGMTSVQVMMGVCGKGLRPRIPDDWDDEIADIVRLSWSSDPLQRLSFEAMSKRLDRYFVAVQTDLTRAAAFLEKSSAEIKSSSSRQRNSTSFERVDLAPSLPKPSGTSEHDTEWEKDSTRRACARCDAAFTMFRRKHHCRGCGKIFCAKCCPKRVFRLCISCALDHREVAKARHVERSCENGSSTQPYLASDVHSGLDTASQMPEPRFSDKSVIDRVGEKICAEKPIAEEEGDSSGTKSAGDEGEHVRRSSLSSSSSTGPYYMCCLGKISAALDVAAFGTPTPGSLLVPKSLPSRDLIFGTLGIDALKLMRSQSMQRFFLCKMITEGAKRLTFADLRKGIPLDVSLECDTSNGMMSEKFSDRLFVWCTSVSEDSSSRTGLGLFRAGAGNFRPRQAAIFRLFPQQDNTEAREGRDKLASFRLMSAHYPGSFVQFRATSMGASILVAPPPQKVSMRTNEAAGISTGLVWTLWS